MKLNNIRKSTYAPVALKEYRKSFILGEKYVRVISFFKYPSLFYPALLPSLISSPDFDMDIFIEHSDMDLTSALKKQMQYIEERLRTSQDPQEQERLRLRYSSLKEYVEQSVKETHGTVNVVVNLYVKADTLAELNEKSKKIQRDIESSSMQIRSRVVPLLQLEYFKKSSPLFISDRLSREENFLDGQLMSSQSAAALFPWIFDTLEDPAGKLIGQEMTSGGKIIFNQFLYETHPDLAKQQGRTSGNMIIVGRTGMGKTVLMNLIVMSHILNHRKIIWIDPEDQNWKLTNKVHGSFISLGTSNRMINIFDLKPISSDDGLLSHSEMYNTNNAIFNVVEDIKITFRTLWKNISEDALSMISEITVDTYASVGITASTSFEYLRPENYPTFSNFSAVINDKIDKYSKNEKQYTREINALKELQMRMRQITGYKDVEGEWGRYFNGITTILPEEIDKAGIISFGTKSLINISPELQNSLLRLIFNYAWSLCLGNKEESVLVIDEEHMFIGVPFLAELLAIIQRRSRKYYTATLTGTQQVSDYSNPVIGQHGKAIFDNSTYQAYMNLTKDGINDLNRLVSLTEDEKNIIANLPPHSMLFAIGNKKIPVDILATKQELNLIP